MGRISLTAVRALRQIDAWPAPFAAAGVVTAAGRLETHGEYGMWVVLG
jgi:hypothetical protein